MRSKWLGLGLGILTLIGCNALWQGYLSPLDDVTDASINNSDLTGADLTGVPPADLTGADLTGVPPPDMTALPKLCGLATAVSPVYRYTTYQTAITLGTLAATKIAAMDIDKDGLAEVAVSTNSSPVKIYKLSITGGTCAYGAAHDCVVSDAIWDLKGFSVDAASNTGTFIAVRNNNSANAFSTCTGIPVSAKTQTDGKFAGGTTRREATVPPIKSSTSGIFTLFEKSNDPTGDRVTAVKLDSTMAITSTVILASFNSNMPFEPRNATGARIDDVAPDGILDVATLESDDTGKTGRVRIYNNNQTASPATAKGTLGLGPNTNGFADVNRLIAARLTNDSYDDPIAIIDGASPRIVPYLVTAGPTIAAQAQITLAIPQAAAASDYRNRILFADLTGDNIDELITFNGNNVTIYTYTAATNTLGTVRNLAVKTSYTVVGIALGYLEKNFASGAPDIFVIINSGSQYEVGVFRNLPTAATL